MYDAADPLLHIGYMYIIVDRKVELFGTNFIMEKKCSPQMWEIKDISGKRRHPRSEYVCESDHTYTSGVDLCGRDMNLRADNLDEQVCGV